VNQVSEGIEGKGTKEFKYQIVDSGGHWFKSIVDYLHIDDISLIFQMNKGSSLFSWLYLVI